MKFKSEMELINIYRSPNWIRNKQLVRTTVCKLINIFEVNVSELNKLQKQKMSETFLEFLNIKKQIRLY